MVLIPILDAYNSLTKSEKIIADFIISETNRAFSMNAIEVAEELGVSPATVGRFSKKIGFINYVDAKIQMAKLSRFPTIASMNEKSLFIEKEDTYQEVGTKLLSQISDVCNNALALIKPKVLDKAVKKLLESDSIFLAGVGASSIVAMDLNLKLIRLKKKTHYFPDYHVNLLSVMTARKQDVLIAFSYSGMTNVVIDTLHQAKNNGAYTIAVSGSANSVLAAKADLFLASPAIEQKIRIGAVSSHYSQQFVADLIFLGMVTHLYDEAEQMISETAQALETIL